MRWVGRGRGRGDRSLCSEQRIPGKKPSVTRTRGGGVGGRRGEEAPEQTAGCSVGHYGWETPPACEQR